MKPAVFLDRDGVLNRSDVFNGRPYAPIDIDRFEILPGAAAAVMALKQCGFIVIVVTNQPDVSTGAQTLENVEKMHRKLREQINIDDIKVKKSEGQDRLIKVDSKIAMEMKYPSLEQFIKSNFDFSGENNVEQSFDLIATCISQILTEEETWDLDSVPKKEVIAFLDQMNSSQFKLIEKFFETMPKLSHEIEVTNPNTNVTSTVVLEGLSSFFA